jgi:hypothetical protein
VNKWEEAHAILHALQSGIAAKIDIGLSAGETPKHLRVGVDNAIIMLSALQKALQDKGIILEDEFLDAYLFLLREEQERVEAELSKHMGVEIKLG